MKYILISLIGILMIAGCTQGDERLSEKATIESKAGSEAAIQAENANLAARATAMENDLERSRRFVDSVVGTYEGVTNDISGKEIPIRMIVTSSFPRHPETHRARSIEELAYELTNLHLNVQVVEWSALDSGSEIAFGCVFEQVRPNIVAGGIDLMSEECKMSYSFLAAEMEPQMQIPVSAIADRDLSRILALDVVNGKIREIPAFVGRKQSSLASKRMAIRVRRVDSR